MDPPNPELFDLDPPFSFQLVKNVELFWIMRTKYSVQLTASSI
jgi:hypothetical protein